jgi:hypothetical protein
MTIHGGPLCAAGFPANPRRASVNGVDLPE